ncbi:MAG: EAL domain-containing protein [Alphaproteobacteria bacterium]
MRPLSVFKTKRRKQPRISPRHIALAYCLFCGTLLIALLSFISLELAASGFVFFALLLVGVNEYQRRKSWESLTSRKIKTLEKSHRAFEDNLSTTKTSLRAVKKSLSTLKDNVAATSAVNNISAHTNTVPNPSAGALRAVKPQLQSANNTTLESLESLESQASRAPSPLIANDDPFGEHASLSDSVIGALLQNVIQSGKINLFLQPIMRLPHRKIVAFELFARIRAKPGLYVPAGRYISMARADNMLEKIDGLLLLECLSLLRKHKDTAQDNAFLFFINIETETLKNKTFMRDLLAYIANNRDMARQLVFEIRHREYKTLPQPILKIMAALSTLGCMFSLDQVEDSDFDLKTLIAQNIRFLKIRAEWVMAQKSSDMDFTAFWRLKNKLESNGIKVIVDHIEQEETLRDLFDFDPHYGQGYLFGKPDMAGAFAPFAFTRSPAKRKGVQESFG